MTGMYPDQTLVRRNAIYIREHIPNVMTIPSDISAGIILPSVSERCSITMCHVI